MYNLITITTSISPAPQHTPHTSSLNKFCTWEHPQQPRAGLTVWVVARETGTQYHPRRRRALFIGWTLSWMVQHRKTHHENLLCKLQKSVCILLLRPFARGYMMISVSTCPLLSFIYCLAPAWIDGGCFVEQPVYTGSWNRVCGGCTRPFEKPSQFSALSTNKTLEASLNHLR